MRVCPVAGVVIGRQLVGRTRFEGVVPSFAVRMAVILLHLVLVLFVVVLETCSGRTRPCCWSSVRALLFVLMTRRQYRDGQDGVEWKDGWKEEAL